MLVVLPSHTAGNIKPLYGLGSFSATLSATGNSMVIVENVAGKPSELVTADRVMPGTHLHFTGIYILGIEVYYGRYYYLATSVISK